jgi:hypothetical protein
MRIGRQFDLSRLSDAINESEMAAMCFIALVN